MNIIWFLKAYYLALYRRLFNPKKIEAHRKKRVLTIVAFAKKHSPYFAKIYKDIDRFEDLPILSKKEMMEYFSDYNTRKISKEKAFLMAERCQIEDVSIGLSSGTSGNRGLFLASQKERAMWAGTILAKTLPHSLFIKTSIGLFLRASNPLYETLSSKRISFSFFDLQKPFPILLEELERIKPCLLVAPPSVLRMLVHHKLSYTPEKIYSCAERLDAIDEQEIIAYFHKPLHQIYQCTEGFLASTCPHGTLHVNEDIVYIEKEYIDKPSGRFIPIITDLYRETQPIIRYRLDDILIEKKEPCPCGSHFLALEKIEGRCNDVLYLRKHDGNLAPLFPDFLTRLILASDESITDYQVIQKSEGEIDLYTDPHRPSVIKSLQEYLTKHGFLLPEIKWINSHDTRNQYEKQRKIYGIN